MKKLCCAQILFLLIAHTVLGAEQSPQPMDSSRLTGTTLSLPEIQGSISVPTTDWRWFFIEEADKKLRTYLCRGPGINHFALELLSVQRDVRTAKTDSFRKHLENFAKSAGGAEILSDTGAFISIENHPDVFQLSSRLRISGVEVNLERYVMNAGSHTAIFTFVDYGNQSADRTAIMSSLRFAKKSVFVFKSDFYFYLAGFLFLTTWILNYVMGRSLVAPSAIALVGVLLLLALRIFSTDWSIDNPDAFGREVGRRLIPMLVLGIVHHLHLKSESKKIAKAQLSISAEPQQSSTPPLGP